MREMRLKKREITDPEILREILESCEVVRIGAMDEEGMFIVPMNYGYDVREEDGTLHVCLYLHGAKEGRKAAAFAADPRVAVEMALLKEKLSSNGTEQQFERTLDQATRIIAGSFFLSSVLNYLLAKWLLVSSASGLGTSRPTGTMIALGMSVW